ncbi:reverse transcriptase domain-containing protein [Tanacetum coccineum]
MFLGYNVNSKGLKVCPDKVDAMLSLPSTKCLKDVQKLNGKLVSLNRFLAKLAEKSLPFFKTLKKCTKKSDFHWTTEAEEAFKQMKQLIAELPMLTTPMEKEELIMYLAAAKETVSAVLSRVLPSSSSTRILKLELETRLELGRALYFELELDSLYKTRARNSTRARLFPHFMLELDKYSPYEARLDSIYEAR